RDWSSDVCSSDLRFLGKHQLGLLSQQPDAFRSAVREKLSCRRSGADKHSILLIGLESLQCAFGFDDLVFKRVDELKKLRQVKWLHHISICTKCARLLDKICVVMSREHDQHDFWRMFAQTRR